MRMFGGRDNVTWRFNLYSPRLSFQPKTFLLGGEVMYKIREILCIQMEVKLVTAQKKSRNISSWEFEDPTADFDHDNITI
jgi:hypothetical protein